jgi:hypothetical protein
VTVSQSHIVTVSQSHIVTVSQSHIVTVSHSPRLNAILIYEIFNKYKTDTITNLKSELVDGEYCWAMTQVVGRSCNGRSGFGV